MSVSVKVRTQELIAQVNGAFGKDTVTLGSDPYWNVEYLPTGILPIDDLLGGGIPYGRFVEIFGNYSTLKSYVGYMAIASCQRLGGLACLIDTEHSFDPKWAKECGVDIANLILKQPRNGEEAIDVAETMIRGGANLIVFDSVAAALPKAEQELMLSGDKNVQPARLASLMSLAMRKLTAANRKTAMIWINQTRVNVGVMFGNPESVPGGKALPFYASMRIALRKAGTVKEDIAVTVIEDGKPKQKKIKLTVAQSIRATVEKSKLNAPFRDVMFNFDFRHAQIDEWFYLVTMAMDIGAIEYNRGQWWVNEKDAKKYRGREAFQAAVGETEILRLLGRTDGKPQLAKFKDDSQKKASSKDTEQKRTRTVARAKSRTTVVRRKKSSK